jgi:creatinine amidohydrolase/Fe(II)-dependent formamide hydrolase-like protein
MIALLPWGAYEQHGPLLPSDTDTTIAKYVAERIAANLDDCIVLPSIPYGVSIEHSGFDNTVSLDNISAIEMLKSILKSISINSPDIDLLVVVNGHGGNQDVASLVCRELNYCTSGTKFEVFHVFPPESRKLAGELFGAFSAHADSVETSVWAHITGKIDNGKYNIGTFGCKTSLPHAMKLYPVYKISECGIVSKVEELEIDKQKGEKVIDCSVNSISNMIVEYLSTISIMND